MALFKADIYDYIKTYRYLVVRKDIFWVVDAMTFTLEEAKAHIGDINEERYIVPTDFLEEFIDGTK